MARKNPLARALSKAFALFLGVITSSSVTLWTAFSLRFLGYRAVSCTETTPPPPPHTLGWVTGGRGGTSQFFSHPTVSSAGDDCWHNRKVYEEVGWEWGGGC